MNDNLNIENVSRRTVLKSGALASGSVLMGATGSVGAQRPIQGTLWAFDERPEPGNEFTLKSNQGGGPGNDGCIAGRTEEWITSWSGWWGDEGEAIAHLRTVRDFEPDDKLEFVQVGEECEAANQEAPPQLVIVVRRVTD